MSNIIDSIQLSGTVYILSAQTSGSGNPTVELTQAEYDALVTAGTVQADTYYIITDAQAGDLTNYYTKTETNTLLNGKQATLVSGTNIKTINNESLLGSGNIDIQGGGKAIEAGRGIAVTTGETADTVSFNLPISAGTGTGSIVANGNSTKATGGQSFAEGFSTSATSQGAHSEGMYSKATNTAAHAEGNTTTASGPYSHAEGSNTTAGGNTSHAEGNSTAAGGDYSFAGGRGSSANASYSFAHGRYIDANNESEHSVGGFNVSNTGSTDADKTLFSVGNGASVNERHNAFEIRQNGDIYITSGGTDIKLQDNLGGVNVVQTTGTSTTDVMSQNAVTTQLSGYVTTNTAQDITAAKTFLWSDSNKKPIIFKQTTNNIKLGFILQNSASTNNELATFELRPDTYTDSSSVKHPLLYLGHYRNTNTANAGVVQTMVGFRQYDQSNSAAYHYLMPLPSEAKTPFSLTTSFKNYFAPLGFKNGSTMITADNTGVVDLSSELGGLKLKKLTQTEYDAMEQAGTLDNSTLYVIVN